METENPMQQTPPVPPQPMPKRNTNPFLILSIILLFIIAIGVSYYLGTLKSAVIPQPTIVPNTMTTTSSPKYDTPSIIPSEALATSLRTITSNDGYSLSYPSNLFVQIICPDGENNFIYLVQRGNEKEDVIQMPTCGRDSRYSIELKTLPKEAALEPTSNDNYTVEKSKITVDGAEGYKYISVKNPNQLELPGPQWSEQVFVTHGTVYEFYVGNKTLEPAFQQILSTIKFTK